MTKPMNTEIDCEQALTRIFDFIDHELEGHECEALERHLQECKSCFSRADFERRLKGKVADLHEERPNPAVAARIAGLLKEF